MSHYSVLVLSEKPEDVVDLLAPFDENIKVPEYIRYTKEELIDHAKKEIERYKNGTYREYLENPKQYLEKHSRNIAHCEYISQTFPKKLLWSDDEIYQNEISYYDVSEIDEKGGVKSTYNPKSKWDWYVVGGRFSDILKLKNSNSSVESYVNEAYASEIDFSVSQRMYKDAFDFWDLIMGDREPVDENEKIERSIYSKERFLNQYGTKENYANVVCPFRTYAVLTPNGEWHEPGEMGWFGVSHATIESEREFQDNYHIFIEEAIKNNWYMTVVDCHI